MYHQISLIYLCVDLGLGLCVEILRLCDIVKAFGLVLFSWPCSWQFSFTGLLIAILVPECCWAYSPFFVQHHTRTYATPLWGLYLAFPELIGLSSFTPVFK